MTGRASQRTRALQESPTASPGFASGELSAASRRLSARDAESPKQKAAPDGADLPHWPSLITGTAPVTGPVRVLGRRESLDDIPSLHGRMPSRNFRLMFVEKYPEKFAQKYRWKCRELRVRLRRQVRR